MLCSTDAVTVEITVLNTTNILVDWNISVMASSQGLSAVSVSVFPSCVTGILLENKYFSISNENVTTHIIDDLSKLSSNTQYVYCYSQ